MNNNSRSNENVCDNNENVQDTTHSSSDSCNVINSVCQNLLTTSPGLSSGVIANEQKNYNMQLEESAIENSRLSSLCDSLRAEVLDNSANGMMSGLEVGSNRLGPALSYPCLPSVSASSSGGSQTHPLPTPTSPLCNSILNNDDIPHQVSSSGSPPSPITRSRSPGSSRRGSPSPVPFLGDGSGTSTRISVGSTNSASSSSRETSVDKDNKDKAYLADLSVSENLSVEGAESGSGSARSLELPSFKNADSSNGHKQAQQQRSTGKRKSTWYQMLNPTYRSRCEDFKRIFKDLPTEERLIVDYSCALQRDILLQGRIYVTQNYLCFYANIFRWETLVQIRWKEVTALTKEKTALVIPNAIQICTESEKHFFCSFGTRDKTYVVLFRTWQQALLDQPLGNQELWKFVHSVYGEELGFSSNDELDVSITPSFANPQPILQNSPSPSLHSAQNSNDDDSIKQLKLTSNSHREVNALLRLRTCSYLLS